MANVMRKPIDKGAYFILTIICLSLILAGGFFEFVSSLVTMPLLVFLLYKMQKEKKLKLPYDINLLSIAVFVSSYLIVSLWAIDSGMAIWGFFKFLPVLLFFILVCQQEEDREWLIDLLPIVGSIMTLVTFALMQIEEFRSWVSVAGRLAGTFQYPNTYGLFVLVCLILSIYKIQKKKILPWFNTAIAAFGIYVSGSRAIMALTIGILILILFDKLKLKKRWLFVPTFLGISSVGAVLLYSQRNLYFQEILLWNLSTFLGRLLYYVDAIPVILRNPFGLGYYGYFLIRPSIQSGVYTVLNVHNEFLQIALDVGIGVAILFYVCILKSLIQYKNMAKENTVENKGSRNAFVLLCILLHSLFDFDFQFISILFILVLFLKLENFKDFKVSTFTRVGTCIMSFLIIAVTTIIGLSSFFFVQRDFHQAIEIYNWNTLARIEQLDNAQTIQEIEILGKGIMESTDRVSLAHSALSRAAFMRGDISSFIAYQEEAIRLGPYQFHEYLVYLDGLVRAMDIFIELGDIDSAQRVLDYALRIPELLDEVRERTHPLGWLIVDEPQVELPDEYIEKLEDARLRLEAEIGRHE